MPSYQNNLQSYTKSKLTVAQYEELWARIVTEKKIHKAMRTRDFTGKGKIPDMRKVIYRDLVATYVPGVNMQDLFPAKNPN